MHSGNWKPLRYWVHSAHHHLLNKTNEQNKWTKSVSWKKCHYSWLWDQGEISVSSTLKRTLSNEKENIKKKKKKKKTPRKPNVFTKIHINFHKYVFLRSAFNRGWVVAISNYQLNRSLNDNLVLALCCEIWLPKRHVPKTAIIRTLP